jgi:hypothetical protein
LALVFVKSTTWQLVAVGAVPAGLASALHRAPTTP